MVDHTLADEIQPYAIDASRIRYLVDAVLAQLEGMHARGVIHPSLHPANIRVSSDNQVQLLGMHEPVSKTPPYAAPETVSSGQLTVASNLYSVAIIMRELVAGRTALAPKAVAVIGPYLDRSAHATASAMRQALLNLQWTDPIGPWRKAFRPRGSTEAAFVTALERDPDDKASRQVYADWLEEHGFDTQAAFLRAEDTLIRDLRSVSAPGEVTWRAVVSRARIAGCAHTYCPGSWANLTRGQYDNERHCQPCGQWIHYCASIDEARACGRRSAKIAVDGALPFEQAAAMQRTVTMNAPYQPYPNNPPMRTWNPPPPQPPPPQPPIVVPMPDLPYPNNPPPPRPRRWWEVWKKKP